MIIEKVCDIKQWLKYDLSLFDTLDIQLKDFGGLLEIDLQCDCEIICFDEFVEISTFNATFTVGFDKIYKIILK